VNAHGETFWPKIASTAPLDNNDAAQTLRGSVRMRASDPFSPASEDLRKLLFRVR